MLHSFAGKRLIMAVIIESSKRESGSNSFRDKENRCNRVFEWTDEQYGGIWHLCTPGEGQPVIFSSEEDYSYIMTLIAICAHDFPDVQIVTFEVMSNHLHLLMCGTQDNVITYFETLTKKLRYYFAKRGNAFNFNHFQCFKIIPVTSLESLRNQIVYINRNNYVVDPDQTPFSYPYGANGYFFSPMAKTHSDGFFGDLFLHDRRKLVRSRNVDYPASWIMIDGYISPVNYVRLDIGEGVFRDARHYFHKVSREIESYKEIADQLGESVYYTDDELGAIVFRICQQNYNSSKPSLLPAKAKIEIARTLHFDYNADNDKIYRLIRLDKNVLDELFPSR